MQWVLDNPELVTALTGVGTLLVWMIYLQVFINSYRRQLRATLIITRGAGEGMDARCFLSNMSSGPVYVQSVIITLETVGETLVCPVTDMLDIEGEASSDPRQRTRQGPLASGEIRDIGSFRALIRQAMSGKLGNSDAEILQTARAIIIEILGIYGSEDLPVGARRRFVARQDTGRLLIEGQEHRTEQIRRKRDRIRLLADLDRDR